MKEPRRAVFVTACRGERSVGTMEFEILPDREDVPEEMEGKPCVIADTERKKLIVSVFGAPCALRMTGEEAVVLGRILIDQSRKL